MYEVQNAELIDNIKEITDYNVKDLRYELPRHENRVKKRMLNRIKMVIVHCTAADDSALPDVYNIARYHTSPGCHICPEHGCPTIAYHAIVELVNNEPVIEIAANMEDIVYAVGKWNYITYNIAVNYSGIGKVRDDIFEALVDITSAVAKYFDIHPAFGIWGHRNLEKTGFNIINNKIVFRKSCPGEIDVLDLQKRVIVKNLGDKYIWNEHITQNEVCNGKFSTTIPFITYDTYKIMDKHGMLTFKWGKWKV